MSQANEPSDRSLDRQLRGFERRITRLEETQLTGKEVTLGFDRVYDEIDALEEQMDERFDRLEREIREIRREIGGIRDEMTAGLAEINNKFDIVMRYITGQRNE